MLGTVLLLGSLALQDAPADWNQFRGPAGRGVAGDDAPLPQRFGPEENLLWSTPVGAGNSSPCIAGERLFLTTHADETLAVVCLDRRRGEVLWERPFPLEHAERLHDVNSAAASTPIADAQAVYAYFGGFGLVALTHDGEERWRRDLPAPDNTFGTAASPVLADGRLLFVNDTNGDSWVESIDPVSGETEWRTEREGFGAAWSTPAVWRRGEVDELLVYGVGWLTAYDLRDGSQRWSVPGLTDEPIVQPATGGGLAFVTSYNMRTNTEVIGVPAFEALLEELDLDGDGRLDREEVEPNASVLSRFDADGEGDHPLRIFFRFLDEDGDGWISAAEYPKLERWIGGFEHANGLLAIRPGDGDQPAEIVWQHVRGIPECPSPLYYEGRVYLMKNGGLASCLDATSGELLWQGRTGARGPCYASPVAGDGKIYSASARGVVTVLEAGDELKVLASNDLGERIMATPALQRGVIYVRSASRVTAFGAGG